MRRETICGILSGCGGNSAPSPGVRPIVDTNVHGKGLTGLTPMRKLLQYLWEKFLPYSGGFGISLALYPAKFRATTFEGHG